MNLRGAAARAGALVLGFGLAAGAAEILARMAGVQVDFDPGGVVAVDEPGLVYTLRPGWRGTSFGEEVRANSLGARGPEPGPHGPRRIVFVGDSYTFGYGVPEPWTYPRRFERALRARGVDAEVINLSVPGCNALQAAASLAARIDRLRPACVIYGAVANDEMLPLLERRGAELHPTGSGRPWMPPAIRRFLQKSRALNFTLRRVNFLRAGMADPRDSRLTYPDNFPRIRRAMKRLRDIGDAHRVRVQVLLLPVLEGLPDQDRFADVSDGVERAAREAGLPFLDASPWVNRALRRGTPLGSLWIDPFDHHPNALANALFAQALADSGWCR